ncbi:MAG TPA: hypothetical protein VFB38_16370 [Chthonomonadaceae bacterium]|nr:hypothetical protein [Chthonomonadaceae bacterium]
MNRFEDRRILAAMLVGLGLLGLLAGRPARATQPPAAVPKSERQPARPAPQSGPKISRFGKDVTITGYTQLKAKADGSGVTILGPNTLVVLQDPRSRSTLRLHADTLTSRKEGTELLGRIDLSGNVRYTITQRTESGTQRTVEGTAGHAFYRRATNRLELTDGVRAALLDPERLSGPGSLLAGRVTVEIGPGPYRYIIEGSNNDIRFTPRENAGSAGRPQPGEVHIYGYESGEFVVGQRAQFSGAGTTVDFDNPTDKTHTRFQANRIAAAFTPDHAALSRAEAEGGVRYAIERPAPSGQGQQAVKGTGARVTYDAQSSQVVLQGRVRADITDSEALLRPARMVADRVVAFLGTAEQPTHYKMTGEANQTRLRFTPRPPAGAETVGSEGQPRNFPIGEVEVVGFTVGEYYPGQSLSLHGPATTFGTFDRATRTRTQFQASHILAAFARNRNVTNVEATGNVRFYVEQPSTATEASGGLNKNLESVTGTAQKVVFTNTPEAKKVVVQGKFVAHVRDPENLQGPGLIRGEAGGTLAEADTLTLDLSARPYEFDISSPKQTASIEFQPRERSQAQGTPAGKAPASSKPGTKKP